MTPAAARPAAIALLLLAAAPAPAQPPAPPAPRPQDLGRLAAASAAYAPPPAPPRRLRPWPARPAGPGQWLAAAAFQAYASLISPQDGSHCSFHPSCGVYALRAVQRHGLPMGLLQACDRLNRCNALSPQLYPYDPRRRRRLDPPPP